LAFACMVAAAVFSRSVLPMVMAKLPPARDDGLARDAGPPTLQGAVIALGIGAFALFTLLPPSVALAALVVGSVMAALILLWAYRRLGGQTGDVLGALQQVFEIAVLSAAAGWSSVFYE
ncbi:MAG: adenosylcobinamide-GDP ribazoletransferase, partial [Rhodospirillales bacterium]|nr:adenosylcobinamide-GDP ribazoletransferase [Rhodospirillales bacterium]